MSAASVQTTYREALREAHREALRRDPRVFLMGEDVGLYGGSYAVSKGLLEEFGPERIRDTPMSESGFVGAGIGAALGGMRPIVEIMTVNFSLLAMDQIVNSAATLRHMSGGQLGVPLVLRMATGAGRQLAAQHSHSLEVYYAHVPGLKVVAPATLADARGMGGAVVSPEDVRARLLGVLATIAPDADAAALDPRANLRETLELDSMDWLAVVQAVHRELGVEIPEAEYRRLRSLDDCVAWLTPRVPAASPDKEVRS